MPAQQTRADSLRQKAIQDSIALMRSLQDAAAARQPAPSTTGGAQGPTNARLLPDISVVGDLIADLSPKGSTQADNTRLVRAKSKSRFSRLSIRTFAATCSSDFPIKRASRWNKPS